MHNAGILQFKIQLIRYKELLEKAGERNLVRVKTTKTTEDLPRFRIMSDVDLEVRQCLTETFTDDAVHLSKIFELRLQPESSDLQQGHKGVERFWVTFSWYFQFEFLPWS